MLPNFTISGIKDTSSISRNNKTSGLIHEFLNSRTDGIRIGLSVEYNAIRRWLSLPDIDGNSGLVKSRSCKCS